MLINKNYDNIILTFYYNVGDSELYGILSAVNARIRSIAVVHIENVCDAHIFLMEYDEAQGRYICATQSCSMSELVLYLAQSFPSSNLKR